MDIELPAIAVAVALSCSWEAQASDHWAFQPLAGVTPPDVGDSGWAKTPVDHFILEKLDGLGIHPNPEAGRGQLVRRLYFDITGLPPTPEEARAFVDDQNPAAYGRLVERLLANPAYGERWGRHWLDVARYGDSMGYRFDDDTPKAYHYRDFVIRALNEDLPFDTFIRWQLAGDELAPNNLDALAATGFAAVGPRERVEGTERNKKESRYIEIDDIVSTTGSAFLGLTLGCARCHDHKTDPISQEEYYSMAAAFLSAERQESPLLTPEETRIHKEWERRLEQAVKRLGNWRETHAGPVDPLLDGVRESLKAEQKSLFDELAKKLPPDAPKNKFKQFMKNRGKKLIGKEKASRSARIVRILEQEPLLLLEAGEVFRRELGDEVYASYLGAAEAHCEAADARPSEPDRCLTYRDHTDEPVPSPLFSRGSIDHPKDAVPLGFIQVLSHPGYTPDRTPVEDAGKVTFQRAALARWITDTREGAGHLLARVMVNRLWVYHFGEGLVTTPNDFGITGAQPAMPELLDWLAQEFIDGGWSLKSMHRLLLTSATYRQSTISDPHRTAADPDNHFWHRRRPVRAQAEVLRDSILAVSGRLNPERFGPGVKLPVPPGLVLSRVGKPYPKNIKDAPPVWRRSVYAFIKRTVPEPMMQTFNAPDHSTSCGLRSLTTVAPQALYFMNNGFVRKRSADFAERVFRETGGTLSEQLEHAYWLALSRPPSEDEQAAGLAFLARHAGETREALTDFCQVIFGLNEFAYID